MKSGQKKENNNVLMVYIIDNTISMYFFFFFSQNFLLTFCTYNVHILHKVYKYFKNIHI